MRTGASPMGNHSRVPAHWSGSAVALTALGLAKALPRSLPLPTNQPTGRSDRQWFRPLPGALGIPAIGSLRNDPPERSTHPHLPHDQTLWKGQGEGSFPVLHVMQDSDFPRGNHSFAFAVQRTCSCACRARYGIHRAFFTV